MGHKYSINIIWSEEDECFVATIPEFPNLSAFGETVEEALADANVVIGMALESLVRDNIDPPVPITHHPQQQAFSGQIRLRMPKSLHADLAKVAEEEGVSLNTHLISQLSKANTASILNAEVIELFNRISTEQNQQFKILHRKIGAQSQLDPQAEWEEWGTNQKSNVVTLQ